MSAFKISQTLSQPVCKPLKSRRPKRRRLSVQTLETRRLLAASVGWDGPGLGDATLTYNIANSPSSLSQGEVNAAVETALDAWSAVADITFVPTSQSGLRDSLDIRFTNIDGPGRTLAQAYLPDDVNPARLAGDIQFDSSENWEVGNSLGRDAFDLVWVAVHEIGHALGLDHLNVAGSVLAPYVSPHVQFTSLAQADVSAIGQLYAPAETSSVSVEDDVRDDVTIVVDTEDPTDSSEETEPEESADDADDDGDVDDTNDSEEDEDEPVDDTNTTDDEESDVTDEEEADDEDEMDDDEHCPEGHRRGRHGRHGLRLLRNTDALLSRFDANADGSITEDEVPEFLWEKLTDSNVDSNADAIVTTEEIDAAVAAARAEKFARFDSSGDGLLQEDEVPPRRWERIVQADSSGDGAVSMDELDAWIEARQMEKEQPQTPANIDQVFAQFARRPIRQFGRRF